MKHKKTKTSYLTRQVFPKSATDEQRRDAVHRLYNDSLMVLAGEEVDDILKHFAGKNPTATQVVKYAEKQVYGRQMNRAELEYRHAHPTEIQTDGED